MPGSEDEGQGGASELESGQYGKKMGSLFFVLVLWGFLRCSVRDEML